MPVARLEADYSRHEDHICIEVAISIDYQKGREIMGSDPEEF
jgi:hypothetical protein